jgi:hypothetical protein
MILTAYDTTIGSSIKTDDLLNNLTKVLIDDNAKKVNLGIKPVNDINFVFTTGKHTVDTHLQIYLHPTFVKYRDNKYMFTDIRYCLRNVGGNTDNSTDVTADDFRSGNEYELVRNKAILQAIWLNNNRSELRNDLQYGGLIYAHWISDILSKRFSLDPRDSLLILIIANLFYQMGFYIEDQYDETLKNKFIIHASNLLRYPTEYIGDIIDKLTYMSNLDQLCSNIRNVSSNIRLSDLNPGIVVTSSANSWFGYESKIMTSVSLEHIPTWICILYNSLKDRAYKNSIIFKIASKHNKNDIINIFARTFEGYIKPYLP